MNVNESAGPRWAGVLIGMVAGAVALGVAEAVAALASPGASPVVAVGGVLVDAAPAAVKEWAVATFGPADKAVLVGGIVTVLAVVAAGLGLMARRGAGYGTAGLVLFGLLGAGAAAARPDSGALDVLPSLAGAVAGAWALALFIRRARADEEGTVASRAHAAPAVPEPKAEPYAPDRRRLLTGLAAGFGVATVTGLGGRLLAGTKNADLARRAVAKALPRPAVPAPPIPAGADLRIPGLSRFVTPNSDFYRVDTALIVPSVDPAEWTLRIHGMVDRPIELTFDDLLKRPLVTADVTLTCVSNEVGGPYVGNARWLGVRLADLLRAVGLQRDADMLLSVSQDGWTCGTPVDVVMDGRDALLAVAMNGEVLPAAHGFPVRLVVPGLYGYVSATKWVTEIKVTRFDRDQAYWTSRGWAPLGPIKTQSRIDVPRAGADLSAGRTTIAGVAWAQHRGVAAVEVRVDGGEWRQATLADAPGPDTWRQWRIEWDLAPGEHTVSVRATDGTGRTQTAEQAPPAPDGATGYHSITVRAT